MKIYKYEISYSGLIKIYEIDYEEKNKIYKLVKGKIYRTCVKTNLLKSELEIVRFTFCSPTLYSLSKDKIDYFKEQVINKNQNHIKRHLESISILQSDIEKLKKNKPIYCFENETGNTQDDVKKVKNT